jgi:hypothetical protein
MTKETKMNQPALHPIAAQPSGANHVMQTVATQREVAAIQGAMLIARQFPRDPIAVRDAVLMACTRPELADVALYNYARGGTDISGPSIRLAEAMAQNYRNIEFGIRELEQRATESTVEAFAIDLETNTRHVKVFQVPHVRYTRSGGRTTLHDPRDIYETVANQGARRLRACILGILPGDLVDAAVRQVEVTLHTKAEITPERIASVVEKFAEYRVTKDMLEKRIQRRIDAISPALMVHLGKIFNSLKDGISKPEDWFDMPAAADTVEVAAGVEGVKAALRKRQRKEPEEAPPAEDEELPISDERAQPPWPTE